MQDALAALVRPSALRMCLPALLLLLTVATGCARYEYSLVEPAQFRQILSDKSLATVPSPPLEYHFRTEDDHLGVSITNTSDQLITLNGTRSYVVDTVGQTHPLPSRAIAPGSYITLLIPPVPPVYRVDYSGGWYGPYPYYPWGPAYYWDYPPGPAYITLNTPTEYYWEWTQPGEFRLSLSYQQGKQAFDHTFLFLRRKL